MTRSEITVGVVGRPVRSVVTSWGDVRPIRPDGEPAAPLGWWVAADDRWHVPADETSIRQRRIAGTPVVETRLRVPDGDAVQRVWSVPDDGGMTIVEVANESPLAFAVAFAGRPMRTDRPPSTTPVQGIDLPDDAVVLPVAHGATIRIGVGADVVAGPLAAVPDADAVSRGWLATVGRASRFELPGDGLTDAVTAARSDLLLDGPVDPTDDPVGFLLDVGELVRLGDDGDPWLPEIVAPLERVARSGDAEIDDALVATRRVALAAGDERAIGDLDRLAARTARAGRGDDVERPGLADLERGGSAGRFVRDAEAVFAAGEVLLPGGIPTPWLGADFAVYGIPTVRSSAVSFAVRWHGERPAVLWEQGGSPVELRAPSVDPAWSSADSRGEALWPPPRRPSRIDVAAEPAGGDPPSFS